MTCEFCKSPCPDSPHAAYIGGGGVINLCDTCAARLCACGAFVLAPGQREEIDGETRHRHHRCEEHDTITNPGTLTWYDERPQGCACHACRYAESEA